MKMGRFDDRIGQFNKFENNKNDARSTINRQQQQRQDRDFEYRGSSYKSSGIRDARDLLRKRDRSRGESREDQRQQNDATDLAAYKNQKSGPLVIVTGLANVKKEGDSLKIIKKEEHREERIHRVTSDGRSTFVTLNNNNYATSTASSSSVYNHHQQQQHQQQQQQYSSRRYYDEYDERRSKNSKYDSIKIKIDNRDNAKDYYQGDQFGRDNYHHRENDTNSNNNNNNNNNNNRRDLRERRDLDRRERSYTERSRSRSRSRERGRETINNRYSSGRVDTRNNSRQNQDRPYNRNSSSHYGNYKNNRSNSNHAYNKEDKAEDDMDYQNSKYEAEEREEEDEVADVDGFYGRQRSASREKVAYQTSFEPNYGTNGSNYNYPTSIATTHTSPTTTSHAANSGYLGAHQQANFATNIENNLSLYSDHLVGDNFSDASKEGYKLLVSNLHPRVTEDDILELFSDIGPIKRARFIDKGLAEVVYVRIEHARDAIHKYDQKELDGRPMVIGFADKNHMSEATERIKKMPQFTIQMNRPTSPLLPTPAILPVSLINTHVPALQQPVARSINPLPITFNPKSAYYDQHHLNNQMSAKDSLSNRFKSMNKDVQIPEPKRHELNHLGKMSIDSNIVHQVLFNKKPVTNAAPVTFTVKL